MRLVRGSGVQGSPECSGWSGSPGATSRSYGPCSAGAAVELEQVCADFGVTPAADPSNEDERFERVRVRRALAGSDWLDSRAWHRARPISPRLTPRSAGRRRRPGIGRLRRATGRSFSPRRHAAGDPAAPRPARDRQAGDRRARCRVARPRARSGSRGARQRRQGHDPRRGCAAAARTGASPRRRPAKAEVRRGPRSPLPKVGLLLCRCAYFRDTRVFAPKDENERQEKKPGNPWTKSLLIWVGVLVRARFVRPDDRRRLARHGRKARSLIPNSSARSTKAMSAR